MCHRHPETVDVDALSRRLAGCPDVAAAYLFGSRARGEARPRSDTDVAVLFRSGMDPVERFERSLDIASELGRVVGGRVDVVDVEAAGAVLVHQILKYGRLLVDRDPARRVRVEVAARRRYLDGRWRRQEYLDGLLQALRGEGERGRAAGRGGALETARRIHRRLGGG